jgi:ATP-dependent helicase/nuclease subunit B
MPIRREFLDWRQPALAAAAGRLRERYERGGELDLSGVIVVVPGGRAGRRLLELLVAMADAEKLVLTPPAIVTPDRFPELLYQAKWPFADALTQQFAWTEALRTAPRELLVALLPFPPEADDVPRWLAVGETLRRLHIELAADGLDCQKVLEGAAAVEGFAEHNRWQTLCKLQERYHKTLDSLQLWDVQSARLVAIKQREIATDRQIVLIGTVDLNRAQRLMLDQIADRVTALIIAPAELAERFDEHGCLLPGKWTEAELPLTDEQVERVDGPAEQAAAITRWLASLDGKYRADQIAIGLPDEKLAPQIERQLAQCGLRGRWAIGQQVVETGPYRLLKIAGDYAARRRFRDLASLVRHPDVYDLLTPLPLGEGGSRREPSEGVLGPAPTNPNTVTPALSQRERGKADIDLLTTLDEFAAARLPAALDPERLAKEPDSAEVLAIHRAVEQLVLPLLGDKRSLGEWADPLRQVLVAVYGSRQLDRNLPEQRYLLKALEAIRAALDALRQIPQSMQPTVDARQACRIVLAQLVGEGIPPPADSEALELLGWLDLPLDDAPATLVTTFNEGWVPSATTADAFLPNRLREALGLLHNDRRLARDAYALSLLLASRENLRLLVARRDSQGNPLAPSRLLFQTDQERVVSRALQYFGELPPQPARRNLLLPPSGPQPRSLLTPPRPKPLPKPIDELSVTRFRDYIACPYRFYLRHMLNLQTVSDEAAELDGGAFGDLAHLVLEQFGRADDAKDVRLAVDPQKIADYLGHKLDQIAAARFGKQHARPAVLVQIEQIRLRLGAFAQWQAERTREGWRIVFSEDSESKRKLTVPWPVDGTTFTLLGRIDRIDYHEQLGRLCVLDYKTADRGDPPQRTHRRGDEWIDLQLPLYRHLVRAAKLTVSVSATTPIDLGYVVLPLDLKSVGLLLADWDEARLLSADAKAEEIIRAIRAEAFWPPTMPPPDFADDMAVICQDRKMGAAGRSSEEEAP